MNKYVREPIVFRPSNSPNKTPDRVYIDTFTARLLRTLFKLGLKSQFPIERPALFAYVTRQTQIRKEKGVTSGS